MFYRPISSVHVVKILRKTWLHTFVSISTKSKCQVTINLISVVAIYAITHHLYADDSQLYVSFSSDNSAAALTGLQSCLASVQSLMSTNKLKLNPDKTEFLLIGNERQRSKYLSMFPIELLGVETYPAKSCLQSWSDLRQKLPTSAHIDL